MKLIRRLIRKWFWKRGRRPKYPFTVLILAMCMYGCENKKVATNPINVDSVIIKSEKEVRAHIAGKWDTTLKFLECYRLYNFHHRKEDSIQIILLQRYSKRLEKLWYYHDSMRVFYAKEQAKYDMK